MNFWDQKTLVCLSRDRGHIYDQMIDRGIPLKQTVGICYLLAGFYAAAGLLTSILSTPYNLIPLSGNFYHIVFSCLAAGFSENGGFAGSGS